MTDAPQTSPPAAADAIVYCCDNQGRLHPVPRAQVTFSPAVYGILIENDQVLLQYSAKTELYRPPGGRVAPEQTALEAMKQHFRAATGVTPIVGDLLLVQEMYRLDDAEKAWHLSEMYYAIKRPSLGRAGLIDFENPARPEWLALDALARSQLQMGYDAIQAARRRLNL